MLQLLLLVHNIFMLCLNLIYNLLLPGGHLALEKLYVARVAVPRVLGHLFLARAQLILDFLEHHSDVRHVLLR